MSLKEFPLFAFLVIIWRMRLGHLRRVLLHLGKRDVSKKLFVARLTQEISGVEMAFAPGFLGGLGKLPVIEAGTEAACNGLRMFRPLVMAKSIIGKA